MKTCPFCGSTRIHRRGQKDGVPRCYCPNCHYGGKASFFDGGYVLKVVKYAKPKESAPSRPVCAEPGCGFPREINGYCKMCWRMHHVKRECKQAAGVGLGKIKVGEI